MANLANLSMIPIVPMPISPSNDNVKELTFKTVPSASKPEIKRLLESFYRLEVQKVRTLNMKGKMKKRSLSLVAKPDYKKAYITLKKPLPSSPEMYPSRASAIQENKNKKVLSMQC